MRSSYLWFGFLLVLLFGVTSFASAQYYGGGFYGAQQVIDSLVQNVEPLLRVLLGGNDWSGYLLFEKLLLFLLISVIASLALSNLPMFKDKPKGILRLVGVIVGLLGVRGLNYVWLNTIFLQYGILFIAVASLIPFIIYWYFLESFASSGLRKIGWSFYSVLYFGLWATSTGETYGEVYLWTALASLFYAFILDGWVQRMLAIQAAKSGDNTRKAQIIAVLKKEIDETNAQIAGGYLARSAGQDIIKRKQEVIKSLLKS